MDDRPKPQYHEPPWIMFFYEEDDQRWCDILPAMRPGVVLERVPPDLAKALVMVASEYEARKGQSRVRALQNDMTELLRGLKELKDDL